MITITITRLARNLADIVNRVAYRNERFTVVRGKRAVAELIPVPAGRPLADLPELLESLPRLDEGDAETFSRDLAEGRALLSPPEPGPWAS